MIFELSLVIEGGMIVEDIVMIIYVYLILGEIIMEVVEVVIGSLIYIVK